PERRALDLFVACNIVGAVAYTGDAVAALGTGTPIGIAIGATWLAGSFMNNFIYYGENRRILWASQAPAVAAAMIGPMLAHGPTLTSTVVTFLILSTLTAARSFSLDHQTLLTRLGERQSALAEVERKLALAVEASGDGMYEADLTTGASQVSAGWAAMLGYEQSEIVKDIFSYVHPDDRAAVSAEFARHFAGATQHTISEQRMRCKDGSYKWVLSRARVVSRTETGQPWRMIGTTIDISDRKA